ISSLRRSPICSYVGSYKNVSALDLASQVLKESIKDINLDPQEINEVILGNVLSAVLGQNVARQIAIKSGIPKEVPAFTVNKVCGSGLKTVALAAQSILDRKSVV